MLAYVYGTQDYPEHLAGEMTVDFHVRGLKVSALLYKGKVEGTYKIHFAHQFPSHQPRLHELLNSIHMATCVFTTFNGLPMLDIDVDDKTPVPVVTKKKATAKEAEKMVAKENVVSELYKTCTQ